MDGSPVDVKFNVDTIPAKGQNVFAEGELVYGENVNPFIFIKILSLLGGIEVSIVGQSANVKIYLRYNQSHSVVVGDKYPVRLKIVAASMALASLPLVKTMLTALTGAIGRRS